MKSTICQSSSAGVTKALGRKLSEKLTSGGVILLEGELGSGKTTFVQGLAEGLGTAGKITSPTFNIMAIYEIKLHPVIKQLVHIDLYRITNTDTIDNLDIPSYQKDPATLIVIEWPERSPDPWQKKLGVIAFESKDFNDRKITLTGEIATLMNAS